MSRPSGGGISASDRLRARSIQSVPGVYQLRDVSCERGRVRGGERGARSDGRRGLGTMVGIVGAMTRFCWASSRTGLTPQANRDSVKGVSTMALTIGPRLQGFFEEKLAAILT